MSPGGSKAHYGSARGLPRMPARSLPTRHVLFGSNGVPHVSHVLINVGHVLHVLSRHLTDETWTPGSFGTRMCPRYKKKVLHKQQQSLYPETSTRQQSSMNAQDEEDFVFACLLHGCIHLVFASARRTPAAFFCCFMLYCCNL